MQILINISESTITDLKKKQNRTEVDNAILNSIPLPEVHGRLGDLDELEQRITQYVNYYASLMDEMTLLHEKFIIDGIKNAPTIIEADTAEGSNEE